MPVPKRTRYEVLRRDGHTCRYCGASAPAVPITIDHVVPVALGGSDDPSNLVAACKDCNAGKSSSSPDSTHVAQVADDAVRGAAAMRAAADSLAADRAAQAANIAAFDKAWSAWTYGADKSRVPRGHDWEESLSVMFKAGLPVGEAVSLIRVAMKSQAVSEAKWRYFCGCAWTAIRDLRDSAAKIVASARSAGAVSPAPEGAACGHCDICLDPDPEGTCYAAWPNGVYGGKPCPHCGKDAGRCLWLAGYQEGRTEGFSEACTSIQKLEMDSGKSYVDLCNEVPY